MLHAQAKELGIKYFLVSFADLFGTQRAKLVPAAAIDDVCETGAGFAGFATWLDMTPADPDIVAMPDVRSLVQLPWKPEIGWLAADLYMGRRAGRAGAAQCAAKIARAIGTARIRAAHWRRMRVFRR